MTQPQATIFLILAATMVLFLWGRWRHDVVALAALLACVFTGLVSAEEAFAGFGHPAVITVACVLVLSQGLQQSGAIDALMQRLLPASAGPIVTMALLTSLAALLSAFMNNIGALALLMPAGIQVAARHQLPAGRILMPLAFGSILGGMTTLIGTPPNLIVSGFRAEINGAGYAMFDFLPVGLVVAGGGILFITLIGWRLVPARERIDLERFETSAYLTEVRVPEKSKAVGMNLYELGKALEKADALVIGLISNEMEIPAPPPNRIVRADDILVLEAEPETLSAALSDLELKLEEDKRDELQEQDGKKSARKKAVRSDEITLAEVAVLPNSTLVGRSATDARLRTRYGVNLLAISRYGRHSIGRLRSTLLEAGDVLLLQGAPANIAQLAADTGCVPLAERELRLPDKRRALTATAIMAAAIAATASGLVPAAISFAAGVLATMLTDVIPLRRVYSAIDWPVIVLLAALLPVAGALSSTGAADLIANALMENVAQGSPIIALTVLLIVTMTLSDFMNNAATSAIMCPIAIGIAQQLGVRVDPMLMAVAIGASCAFLTPIGHQNNTLILGPGGFRFSDYWRLGLPLELLVIAIGVPMILLVWPL
ncbi:SLC13 family permease [Caldilinea sp.]|jgi:di/tricarboxylate transporter|uniref:SLC13 family permease n=1 Tax=Caldilinea sp. TaxID=2293560 RepID=UPI001B2AA1D7|nr:SLC13 family permease [Caldilinea sp.]MBO9391902.1 SLC13 family permease [Caldilinea sp.]